MIETYFLNNDLGYITIPQSLSKDGKVTIDHLGQGVIINTKEKQLVVIKAFLGNTKEESKIKTINWFVSRKLSISTLEDWYFQDLSNYARMYKTYDLVKMSKYLVKEIKDYFDRDILISVLEVLEILESKYGTIIVGKYVDSESWSIQTYFLHELESWEYKFSDDEKYNNWINE